MRVRFAPSPTGHLHVGNLRTALLNYLWAKNTGGQFMLRIDDTDTQRSKPEYEDSIRTDLKTLGLTWDLEAHQSARLSEYEKAAELLKEKGRLYDCYETAEELELQRRVNLSQGRPPVYDRAALELSDADKASLKAEGRKPHWRFRLDSDVIAWHDHGRGDVSFESGHLSDPVLFREDGRVLYTLSSVVDDGAFEITHVVRGEDHVVNTAVQIDIFQSLNLPVPQFAHVPLLLDKDGKGLSKRIGSLGVRDLLGDINADSLLAYLTHLGLSVAADGQADLQSLIKAFDMSAYGRASPRFDLDELKSLAIKYLRKCSYADVKDDLQSVHKDIDEAFWLFIRDNMDVWEDVVVWSGIVFSDDFTSLADFDDEAIELLKTASDSLPDLPTSDDGFYPTWIEAVKDKTGLGGKKLFVPLRLALTGKQQGPELKGLLAFLNHEEIKRRLRN